MPPAIAWIAGAATISIPITSTVPRPSASQVAWTPTSSASSTRPAPYRRAARAVVPYSRKVQNPKISESRRPDKASPASGTVPRWPMIAVSPRT